VGAAVERITAECVRGLLGRSNCQYHSAVRRALAHRVSKIVGEIEHVVGAHRGAVGIGKADILAPGAQEFSVPIIDDDGMSAARVNVDIILTVDTDGGGVAVRIARRQLAPVLNHPISVISLSENDR
jgi:hypothetical protein